MELQELLQGFDDFNSNNLFKTDFLLTWEKSKQDLELVVRVAETLKMLRQKNISPKLFDSGLAVSIFRDNSTRTRYSYASAANLLGLTVEDLDENKSQISHGETVRETANMISFMTDFIGIRDDMYPGLGHSYMKEVASALDEGIDQGVLEKRPNIINLQCDLDHPTQSVADLIHLKNYFGGLDQLKGKKICMSWAYSPSYGKPMSVPQGIIALMGRFGMDVTLAHPPGYELLPEIMTIAKQKAEEAGGSLKLTQNMEEGIDGMDVVYAKSWAPLQIMKERTQLVRNHQFDALDALEKKCLAQNAQFMDWEFDQNKLSHTKKGAALYMHCLPADISGVNCKHGEVSESVFEKYRLKTYKEAAWKPYVIAAMMLCSEFVNPGGVLQALYSSQKPRILT
jgi:knotted carbamoyltransferase YgeW